MPKHDDTQAPIYLYATREQWLNAFVEAARFHFDRVEFPIPEKIRISVGFTSHGKKGNRIGECWTDEASSDGHYEIFLKPVIVGDARMADILTHELVHTAVGIAEGHGKRFKSCAEALGLGGRMTSTVATEEWFKWALPILDVLGPMPYGTLEGGISSAKPKQKTNLLKCVCDDCGFTARITARWITDTMQCPDTACGGAFHVA